MDISRPLYSTLPPYNRSGSMSCTDRVTVPGTPATARISRLCNNRLGAVYSSLYSFWRSRQNALGAGTARRDTYSILLFNDNVTTVLQNDLTSSPDQLLDFVLMYQANGGTDYATALVSSQSLMESHWSTARYDAKLEQCSGCV